MKTFYTSIFLTFFLAGGLTAQTKSTQETAIGSGPELENPIANVQALSNDEDSTISLTNVFTVPEEKKASLSFAVLSNAYPEVAAVSINDQDLTIDFLADGQTTVIIEASSNEGTANDTFLIGTTPKIMGEFEIASFDDLTLEAESFWNGADGNGGFVSGPAHFVNNYNTTYGSWSGWAYSNISDNVTPGFMNQYSAFTGQGFTDAGNNYGASYGTSELSFEDGKVHAVEGVYVTNATYTALSMKAGDDYSKKFGGVDGSEADCLKLSVNGYKQDQLINTVDFLLADFSDADNTKDYIVETWQFVNLTSLGGVDHLEFALSSTDNGDWGMNTPAYFSLDNLLVHPYDNTAVSMNVLSDLNIYPNPSDGIFRLNVSNTEALQITVNDLSGREIFHNNNFASDNTIDLSSSPDGTYIVRAQLQNEVVIHKIIKR